MEHPEEQRSSLTSRASRAVVMLGSGRLIASVLHYLVYLVLALILPAEDFGLLGMGMIFVMFFESVGDLGLRSALIQRDQIDPETADTAFWSCMLASILLGLFAFTAAVPITTFLGDSRGAPLLRALALLFPVYALSSVPLGLLERKLKFQALSAQAVVGEICYAAAGIGLGLSGWGVWSLVGATLAQRIGGVTVLWRMVDWRPGLEFNLNRFRELLRFGVPVLAVLTLQRAAANMDYFVISRWLGTESLGYYTLAFQLTIAPAQRLTGLADRILFPAFSEVKSQTARLATAFFQGLRNLMAMMVPFCLFLVVLSPAFIEAIYDKKWLPSAPSMQILAGGALLNSLDFSQAVFFALGRPSLRVVMALVKVVLFITFVQIWGVGSIEIVAAYLVLCSLVPGVMNLFYLSALLGRPLSEILGEIWGPVRAGLLLLILERILSPWTQAMSPALRLVVIGPPLLGACLAALHETYRKIFQTITVGVRAVLDWRTRED